MATLSKKMWAMQLGATVLAVVFDGIRITWAEFENMELVIDDWLKKRGFTLEF